MKVRKDVANKKRAVRLRAQSVEGSIPECTNMLISQGSLWKNIEER